MDSFGSIGSEIDGFAADVRVAAAELFGDNPIFVPLRTKIGKRLDLVITTTTGLAQPFARPTVQSDGRSLWLLVACVGHGANWFNAVAFNASDMIAEGLGIQPESAEAVADFLARLHAEIIQQKGAA